jgi:hypothetical protein
VFRSFFEIYVLRRLPNTLIQSQVCPTPSAGGASAAALDVLKNFVSLEAIYRKGSRM